MSCSNNPGPGLVECGPIYTRVSYNVVIAPGFSMGAALRTAREFNAIILYSDPEEIYCIDAAIKISEYKPDTKGQTRKPWTKTERYKKRFF